MKKTTIHLFIFFTTLLFVQTALSQIGIGRDNPRGALDIGTDADLEGLVYPVVPLVATNVQTVVNPSAATAILQGTTVYNNTTVDAGIYSVYPGMYTWDGTEWVPQFSKKDYKLFNQNTNVRTGSSNGTYGDQDIPFDDDTFIPRNYGNYKILVRFHYGAGTVDVPSSPQFVNFVAAGGEFDFTFNGTTTTVSMQTYSGYNNDSGFNGGSTLTFENQYNQTTISLIETLDRGAMYPFTLSFNQDTADGFEANGDISGGLDGTGYVNIKNSLRCTVEITYIGK